VICSQLTISKERASEIAENAEHDLEWLNEEGDILVGRYVILTVYKKRYTLVTPVEYCYLLKNLITSDEFCDVYEIDRPENFSEQRHNKLCCAARARKRDIKKEEERVCRFCWQRPPVTKDGRCEQCRNAVAREVTSDMRTLSSKCTEYAGRKSRSTQVLGGCCEFGSDRDDD
jgi:hypothetical protein